MDICIPYLLHTFIRICIYILQASKLGMNLIDKSTTHSMQKHGFFCRNQSKTQSFIFLHASWPLLIYCIYIRTHKTGHRDKRYRTYLESKTRVIDVNAYLDIIPETELNGKVSWLDTLDTGLVQVKSQAVTILTHINIHTYMMLGLVNIEYIQSTMSNELSSITEWMFVLRYFNRSVYYFRIRYQHGATRILRTSDSASLIMPVRRRPAGSLRPTTPQTPPSVRARSQAPATLRRDLSGLARRRMSEP